MDNGRPFFVRFNGFGNRFSRFANNIGGWFLIAPGVSLVLMGLAIIVWPALLAYMVASLFIVLGMTLALWGWRVSRIQKQMHRRMQEEVYYQHGNYHSSSNTPFERF